MRLPRASGILLHITSLPGPFGIGDVGPQAERFADFLADTGQSWWQVLPLGPPVYGNSPYQAHSSRAGDLRLISPERLADSGLIDRGDFPEAPLAPHGEADFDQARRLKESLLRKAYERVRDRGHEAFDRFRDREAFWLADFALFMAIKGRHGGVAWIDWPAELAGRDREALDRARNELADEIAFQSFVQFVFDEQWRALRSYCRDRHVGLIGDVPIFVAQDSAEVWSRPDLFQLDFSGRPTFVAGVPPDYFNSEGQLWGNPVYRWEIHQAEGFSWWIDRLKGAIERVDQLRLDHFRGFEAYWRVPAGAPNAIGGQWIKVPGYEFLSAVREAFGGLPLLAEDLGHITQEVEALRDQFGLPGMKVLQFAFGRDPGSELYRPYAHPHNSVVYTGTHDNDTTQGWFHAPLGATTQSAEEIADERDYVARYTLASDADIHWGLIRAAMGSPADTVLIPLQDVLGLGSEARMNTPGTGEGNWLWRFREGDLTRPIADRLADVTLLFGRWRTGPAPRRFRGPKQL